MILTGIQCIQEVFVNIKKTRRTEIAITILAAFTENMLALVFMSVTRRQEVCVRRWYTDSEVHPPFST